MLWKLVYFTSSHNFWMIKKYEYWFGVWRLLKVNCNISGKAFTIIYAQCTKCSILQMALWYSSSLSLRTPLTSVMPYFLCLTTLFTKFLHVAFRKKEGFLAFPSRVKEADGCSSWQCWAHSVKTFLSFFPLARLLVNGCFILLYLVSLCFIWSFSVWTVRTDWQ